MATLTTGLVLPIFEGSTTCGELADREAFTALYERHAPRIHRFLRDLLGDAVLAADATQETFARVFSKHREMLRDEERAVPWLFGVARNVSLELRKTRMRAGRVLVSAENADAPSSSSPERDALGREAMRVIDAALAQLSEERRALLLLRMDHGLAYEAIAELMGFSLAKVKVEIHRARLVLRDTLDAYRRGEPIR